MTNRGWSNTVLGDYPQAIADYEAALAIDPGSVLALLDRAWTHALMGNPQLGLSDADAALALAPGRPAALSTRAQILAVLGRTDEALAGFEAAIGMGGGDLVRAYQRRLAARGYNPGPVDGGYGGRTKEALIACIAEACNMLQDP